MGVIGNFLSAVIMLIGGSILAGLTGLFGSITYVLPQQVQDSIIWLFGYLNVLRGIMPISDIMAAVGAVITIWGLKYAVEIVLHIMLPVLPFIGTHLQHPDMGAKDWGDNATIMHNRFKSVMGRNEDKFTR